MVLVNHPNNAAIATQVNHKGTTISLIGMHPFTPVAPQWLAQQRRMFGVVERYVLQQRHPVILIGDMNSVSWAPRLERLRRHTHLKDTATGFGVQPSWGPTKWSVPLLPIDHVFVSEPFQVVSRRLGPQIGSDHRAVIVELAVI